MRQFLAGMRFQAHDRVIEALRDPVEEHDADAEARARAEGIADAEAGRLVPHDEVVGWVKSWGTDHELSMPGRPAK